MQTTHNHLWGILLAGGDGRRMQPFIRARFGCDRPQWWHVPIGLVMPIERGAQGVPLRSFVRDHRWSIHLAIWEALRMPCLIGQFDPKMGVGLQVIVTPPERSPRGVDVPPSAVPRLALIDTGTTTTIITPQVVQELGLQPTGKMRSLVGTMQSGPVDTYCVTLVLPMHGDAGVFPALEVLEAPLDHGSYPGAPRARCAVPWGVYDEL